MIHQAYNRDGDWQAFEVSFDSQSPVSTVGGWVDVLAILMMAYGRSFYAHIELVSRGIIEPPHPQIVVGFRTHRVSS